MVKVWKKLTIFAKRSILDVSQGSAHVSNIGTKWDALKKIENNGEKHSFSSMI